MQCSRALASKPERVELAAEAACSLQAQAGEIKGWSSAAGEQHLDSPHP